MKFLEVFFAAAAVVAAGAAMVACDSTVELAPDPLSEEDFAAKYAQAFCSAAACCDAAGNEASCVEIMTAKTEGEVSRAGQVGATFDAEVAALCLEALRQNAGSCTDWKDAEPYFDVCLRVYADKPGAPGDTCEGRWDCADSAGALGACWEEIGEPAACALFRTVGEGEECGHDHCAGGLQCIESVCQRRFRRGEACTISPSYGDTCETGSVCDRDVTGVCVEALPLGASCEDDGQCEGRVCRDGGCRWPGAGFFGEACSPTP